MLGGFVFRGHFLRWSGAGPGQTASPALCQKAIKKPLVVILSAAKNLALKTAEILHSAALRSE
jgi:hypothetical protein